MTQQRWRQAAGALLAIALSGIALTHWANQRAIAIQGPGALQAIGDDSVWLGVNEEVWVLDRDGQRQRTVRAQELGLSAAASNFVPAPQGQVLVTSREDRDWQLVDAATLRRVRTLHPQWPAGFADAPLSALHAAVSPEGDIAVGTGGGHTVLLFDREGRLKARSAPGSFHFTNGLWWSPQGWWTTDTNRSTLRLLDAQTLAARQAIALPAQPLRYRWLGETTRSQGAPLAAGGEPPLATVTRLGFLMEPGHAVDLFADGRQALYNREPIAQLRDIAWFDGHLLLVDGASYTVRRYAADRSEAGEFGDARVRAPLQRMHEDRAFWLRLGSRYLLLLSALLLLAGIAAYVRARRLAALERVAAREGGQAAALPADRKRLAWQRLRLWGPPIAVRLLLLALYVFVLVPWLQAWQLRMGRGDPFAAMRLLLLAVAAPVILLVLWEQRRWRRFRADPAYEPMLNHRAIEWLRAHDDFDRIKLEGEVARETVRLLGWRERWLLVTNRRLLLFVASARERRLQSEWPRRAVVFAGPPHHLPGAEPVPLWRRTVPPNLVLAFTTGTVLRLHCASAVTAQRVSELLMSSPALPEDGVLPRAPRARRLRRRWSEPLASLLVPGTGQWLQGRFATGAVLFTAGLLLTVFDWGPLVWALHGPKMDVAPWALSSAALTWLLLALAASSDALRFCATRRR